MNDDVKRNWIGEATAIAAGQSMLLPEKEHILALAAQMESVLQDVKRLGAVVLAVMVDNNFQQLPIPGGLVRHIETQRYGLFIEPLPDGSLVAKLQQAPPPTPKGRLN